MSGAKEYCMRRLTVPRWFVPLICLLAVTMAAYVPALRCGFVNIDDDVMLSNNPLVRSLSAENITAMLTRPQAGMYHPLVTFSYAVEYHFFGLNPVAFHATNILLHCLNAVLVFWLVCVLFSDGFAALVAALLFALHPVHVESVAWISERKDVLYAFFFLGSLIAYGYYRRSGTTGRYAVSVALFTMSLLAKPMALSLPVVILLVDLLQGRRDFKKMAVEKVPYLALALAAGAVALGSHYAHSQAVAGAAFSLPHNALNAVFNLVFYVGKVMYPDRLAAFYPYSTKFPPGISPAHIAAVAVAVALAVAVAGLWKRSRCAAFGPLFFGVTVFPVLQFVPVGQEIPADRYMYLPSLGLYMTFGLAAAWFYRSGRRRARIVTLLLIAAVTVMLASATRQQVRVWRDSLSLWTATISRYPEAFAAYRFRADAWRERHNYPAAFADLATALRLRQTYPEAYNTRGNLYAASGASASAIQEYSMAIAQAPSYAAAYYNRAVARAALGDEAGARDDYLHTLALHPRQAQAHNNLGVLFARQGDFLAAVQSFTTALAIEPGLAAALQNRDRARAALQDSVPSHTGGGQ
jgi:tetratricopeptide (TPR) repeat protein